MKKRLTMDNEICSYTTIFSEIKQDDQKSFLNYIKMLLNVFEPLLRKVIPYVSKENTIMRKKH